MSATPLGKALAALMVEESSDLAPAESFFTRASAATSTPDYRAFWDKDASFIEVMQALYLRVRDKNKGVLYAPRPADAEPATTK